MPIKKEDIRKILLTQKYDNFVVADLLSFADQLPGAASTPTMEAKKTFNRYKEWAKLNQPYEKRLLPVTNAKDIHETAKRLNQQTKKVAECSNFAYHAMSVLLNDPTISAEYNVVLAGTMGGKHNVAILIPRNEDIPQTNKVGKLPSEYRLPKGSLIVDPWTFAMGYPADKSLAVEPDDFAFHKNLYNNLSIGYQSKNDSTVAQPSSNLSPKLTAKIETPVALPTSQDDVKPKNESHKNKKSKKTKKKTKPQKTIDPLEKLTDSLKQIFDASNDSQDRLRLFEKFILQVSDFSQLALIANFLLNDTLAKWVRDTKDHTSTSLYSQILGKTKDQIIKTNITSKTTQPQTVTEKEATNLQRFLGTHRTNSFSFFECFRSGPKRAKTELNIKISKAKP